jgi:hypothetical protein
MLHQAKRNNKPQQKMGTNTKSFFFPIIKKKKTVKESDQTFKGYYLKRSGTFLKKPALLSLARIERCFKFQQSKIERYISNTDAR